MDHSTTDHRTHSRDAAAMRSVPGHDGTDACARIPELRRLTYFYGQLLGPHDLRGEQSYLREKLRLANRFLHGWGVVCGLDLCAVPAREDCPPETAAEERPKAGVSLVRVRPGVAFDCHGEQLVLRDEVEVDLWCELSRADRERVEGGCDRVYLSICYCERPVEPTRPVLGSACGVPEDCVYARIREAVALHVTVDPPRHGDPCEPCCGDCPDPCLVLGAIRLRPGEPVESDAIDGGVRRMITRHQLTTIAGISWVHGATYSQELTRDLLRRIELRFSRPVLAETLVPGVVDLIVFEGPPGRAGGIYSIPGRFVELPEGPLTDRLVYRQLGGEWLQRADRVLIQVRADFILDRCCRAVDGNHLGGRVPLLPGYERFDAERPAACATPPSRPGAWTSGNGSEGGTFESWFFVERERDDERSDYDQ